MKRYLACAVALIAAVVVLVVLPLGAGASSDKRFVLGEQGTFTGSSGSVTMHGTGSSCIDGSNRGIFDAKFTITGGTGTYANLSGKGSATGEIDLNDGTFTTVFDGTAHFAH